MLELRHLSKFCTALVVAAIISPGLSVASEANFPTLDDLYERNGVWYKKFSNDRYSGKVFLYKDIADSITVGVFRDGIRTEEIEHYFSDGSFEGREWRENGQLKFYEMYHPNGVLRRKESFDAKGDPVDGVITEYYPTGFVKSETRTLNGQAHGDHIMYREDGSKAFRTSYQHGVRHGESINYDFGGFEITSNWAEGRLHGLSRERKDGVTVRLKEYVSGKLVFDEPLPDLIDWHFPICEIKSSLSQFCKSLLEATRYHRAYSKTELTIERVWRLKGHVTNKRNTVPQEHLKHLTKDELRLSSEDWIYTFQTIKNGDGYQIRMTDDAKIASYSVIETFDLKWSEQFKTWSIVGSVVDYIAGSKADKEIEGIYVSYEQPIYFIEGF